MDAEEERVGNGAAAAGAAQGGNTWDFEEGESLFVTLCIACVGALFTRRILKTSTSHVILLIYICFLTYLSHHLLSRSPFVVLPWRGRQRRFRAFHQ